MRPEVRLVKPRICLKCWLVITEEDINNHQKAQGHVLTGPFEKMQPAKADSLYGLAKKEKRVGSGDTAEIRTIQRIGLSDRMQVAYDLAK